MPYDVYDLDEKDLRGLDSFLEDVNEQESILSLVLEGAIESYCNYSEE